MLLEADSLSVTARGPGGSTRILRDVSFSLDRGDRLGLIGESGSGKTTIVRSLIALLDGNVSVTSGELRMDGRVLLSPAQNLVKRSRGRDIGVVFQSALTSLHPLRRLGTQLDEVLAKHKPELRRIERGQRAAELLAEMGIQDPVRVLHSYPHEVSGGQRQRAVIALAMASDPVLLVADECTSALDVQTQEQVVRLLARVSGDSRGLLFVTHDLALAYGLCNRFVVLEHGVVVEQGDADRVILDPQHPYTRGLIGSIPPWRPRDGSWPPRWEELVREDVVA